MSDYKDNLTGKIFEMSPSAFEKMLAKTKMADGRPRYTAVTIDKKKAVAKSDPLPPMPTKAQKLAETLNDNLQAMTARQLVEAIKEMTEVPQLQALAQDGRKTVAAAAQARLAEGAVNEGGSDE